MSLLNMLIEQGWIPIEISRTALAEDVRVAVQQAVKDHPRKRNFLINVDAGNIDRTAIEATIKKLSGEHGTHALLLVFNKFEVKRR